MASDVDDLLVALKKWRGAIKQLKKKGKSPEQRERQLRRAEQGVLTCLESDAVVQALEDLIEGAIAAPEPTAEDVRRILIQNGESLLTVELRTVHPLSVSRKDLEKLVTYFLTTADDDRPVSSSAELKAAFAKLSDAISTAYRDSRTLSRKPKKRRRRDLAMGTLQTALGLGLLAGNTQLKDMTANSSYILGGNALMAAMQNLVGKLDDEDYEGS